MDDILGAIMKGAIEAQRAQSGRSTQSDPMADLIGGILGGQQQRRQPVQPTQPDITDIIGQIMGGGAAQQRQQPVQPQQPGINDLIGAIMGGSSRHDTGQAGGLGDLIGILGGGSRRQSANPIAQIVAQRFGIPPALAQAAVSFLMARMMKNMMAQRQAPRQMPSQPSQDDWGIGRAKPQGSEDINIDDLLDSLDDESTFDERMDQTGMAEEFAEKANIDKKQAGGILKGILEQLGAHRAVPEPVRAQPDSLEDLIDAW